MSENARSALYHSQPGNVFFRAIHIFSIAHCTPDEARRPPLTRSFSSFLKACSSHITTSDHSSRKTLQKKVWGGKKQLDLLKTKPFHWSEAIIPGVDECRAEICKRAPTGSTPAACFTPWGVDHQSRRGIWDAKLWAKTNIKWPIAVWGRLFQLSLFVGVREEIRTPFERAGHDYGGKGRQAMDTNFKHLSQAFAEEIKGEVYVFVPKDVQFQKDSCWLGWEFAAHTHNEGVTEIWKVESKTDHKKDIKSP